MLRRHISEALHDGLIDQPDDSLYRGRIDHFDESEIAGWCINLRAPDEALTIEVSFLGTVVHRSETNLARPELEQALGAPCRPGFVVPWASCIVEQQDIAELSARALLAPSEPADMAITVLAAGRTVGCLIPVIQPAPTNSDVLGKLVPIFAVPVMPAKLPILGQAAEISSAPGCEPHECYRGYIEGVDESGFRGWCLDLINPQDSIAIRLSVLGRIIGAFNTALPRPDIEARYGFCGSPGFRISWAEMAMAEDAIAAFDELPAGLSHEQFTFCWTVVKNDRPVSHIPFNPNKFKTSDIIAFLKSRGSRSAAAQGETEPREAPAPKDSPSNQHTEIHNLAAQFRNALELIFDKSFYLNSLDDTQDASSAPFEHFLAAGLIQDLSPCALFSVKFYRSQQSVPAGLPAILHYLQHPESLANPHPLLNTAHLREKIGDAAPLKTALEHYIAAGWSGGADPHVMFDQKWYCAQYGKKLGARTPLEDYLANVSSTARNPHPLFNRRWYRTRYPDVARARLDPLEHFIRFGAAELREPNELFDSRFYRATYQGDDPAGEPPFLHYLRLGQEQDYAPHWLVDPAWVRGQLDRLGRSEGVLSALLHKCVALSLDPNPCFSVKFYLRRYPEIAARRIHPVSHYLQHGWKERRVPHSLFWPEWFCAQAGARIANTDPLRAYLRDPALFDIPPCPYFDPALYRRGLAEADRELNPLLHFTKHAASDAPSPNSGMDMPWARLTYRIQAASLQADPLSFVLMHRNGFVTGNPDGRPLDLVPGADAADVAKLEMRLLGGAAAQVRRRRLVYLSHNMKIQGAQTSLFELATGMARDPLNDVMVLAPDDGPMKDRYHAAGIPVHKYKLPVHGMADEKQYGKLSDQFSQQITALAPDVLHGNTIQAYHAIALATRAGIPAVWNIRESEDPASHFSSLTDGAQQLLSQAIASPAEFIFVSRATAAVWTQAYPDIRHMTICNGIKYANFQGHARNMGRQTARAWLGVRDNDVLLFNVGTWTERKGQRDIFEAVRKIDRRLWPRLKILLIGRNDTPYARSLMEDFSELPRALRECFIFQDESTSQADRALVLGAFNAADIFLFSSRIESYPRVVNEALYFGLPIVSTSCFGVLEQLEPGVTGLLYDAGDTTRLARYLEELTTDPPRRRVMRDRARHAAFHGVVQYEEMLSRYASVYKRLVRH